VNNLKTRVKGLHVFLSLLFCVIVSSFFSSSQVFAAAYKSFGPISLVSQNPIYLQNLQLQARRATALLPGSSEVQLDYAFSNVFEWESNNTYDLNVDMEVHETALSYHRGFQGDIELGARLPFYTTGGGFLDAFLDSYHNAFSFPRGGREFVNNGTFNYQLSKNGTNIFSYPEADFDLGDIVLSLKQQFFHEDQDKINAAWFVDFKVPTGTVHSGFSSGRPDFLLGLAADASFKSLRAYLNTALVSTSGLSALQGYMNDQRFAFSFAAECSLLPTWSAIVQLSGGTALLKGTALTPWNDVPLDLIIGFRGEEPGLLAGNDLFWQFGFSEDVLSVGPSVDFTTFFSLGIRFGPEEQKGYQGDWYARSATHSSMGQ